MPEPPAYDADAHESPDPLRLCVAATTALLGWVLGPVALVAFAGVGVAGYASARRGGLLRSRCKLGDTRLVLAYLAVLVVLGVAGTLASLGWGTGWWVGRWTA
ncbi:MAG: hypothetical protein CMH83_17320 [Nocardioides sp.]|nr:hypothetical protein [Nocardioides sp.]